MKNIIKNKETLIIFFIIIITASLRFYNYGNWSLSNDELSALNRARFSTVGEVIKHGVKEMDTHPAGVQVFIYYWTKLFGNSEKAYRFPFVIAGILSVLFSYLIFSKWFNKTSGIFIALTMSFLSYFILYSQLARPYSFGLLFVLICTFFWTKLITKKNPDYLNFIAFSLFATLSAYTHYFAMFTVIIIGITGLLIIKKDVIIPYCLACFASVLFFLPHLKITLYQMQYGMDNVSWIPVPNKNWIWKYLDYAFNNSALLQFIIIGLILINIILYYKDLQWNKFRLIALMWFLIVYFTAYFYSIFKSPLLQYSILIFVFPFLLGFIFSTIHDKLNLLTYIQILVLLIFGLYTTIFQQKFYKTQHFGVFKDIAELTCKWEKQYGDDNITRITNIIHPYYIKYYNEKQNCNPKYKLYSLRDYKNLSKLTDIVESSKTPYFEYSWSNVANLPETEEIIRTKYNKVIEKTDFFNSGIRLFFNDSNYKRPIIYQTSLSFETIQPEWKYYEPLQSDSIYHSDSICYMITPNEEYSKFGFEKKFKEINPDNDSCIISLSAYILSNEKDCDGDLVMAIKRNDSTIYWNSAQIRNFIHTGKWCYINLTRFAFDSDEDWILNIKPDDIIKIYFWNTYRRNIFIDDVQLNLFPYHER